MTSFFSNIWLLAKKELADSFRSSLLYVLTGFFSLLMGWLFFNYLVLSSEMTAGTLLQSVFNPIFGNMNFIFLFFAPLLTMHSFALEKRQGTLGLLLLSNLSHIQIILGKFIAIVLSTIFMLSFTLILPLILSFAGYSQWALIFTGYAGIIFSICCYVSVGIFASSLTDNPVISAVISFCILMGMMLIVLSANASDNPIVGEILSYLAIPFHYEGFVRGAVKSYSLVYFVSVTGFFLWLSERSLESRNW